MSVRLSPLPIALLLAASGCLSDEKHLTTVPGTPFGQPVRTQAASMKQAPPATQKVAMRVSEIGRKVLAANPRINQQVAFLTLGVSQPELFHQVQKDGCAVSITEGLVKQCKSDNELAALLCEELGKMEAEKAARTKPVASLPERPPLLTPRVGNDIGGSFGSADGTDRMILARYEKDRQQAQRALTAPQPDSLARLYLRNAGYDAKDLDAVAPLLRQADQNDSVEQLMTGKTGQ